tara:strand:+ start:354 stop:584 length:231 start_codon:yes stop_codon:yes gene_type:complete
MEYGTPYYEHFPEDKKQTCIILEEIKKVVSDSGIDKLRKEIRDLKEENSRLNVVLREKNLLIEKLLAFALRHFNID